MAWAAPFADAQTSRVWRIAYLAAGSSSSDAARIEAFRRGLSDVGYVEGENLTIQYRFAEGRYERLAALAAELVNLMPDVIFTHTSPGASAARNATTTIPIVFGAVGHAERRGFVDSLARPNGT
jgi:putative ABC transport system substrate-binding protein